MMWDGTRRQFLEAIERLRQGGVAGGVLTHDDVTVMREVLEAAVSARELRTQMARLETMVGQAATSTNESKRMRNEMEALEAEVKRLAEKLKGAL